MSVLACRAKWAQTPGFFRGSASRCKGFKDRTPDPIAVQRDYYWDNSERMAREVYASRAQTRKTLSAFPDLVCETCPEFLLPLNF